MPFPFGIKLGLSVILLTVGLTTASVYHFYTLTSDLVRRQVTGRLRDIGHTSTFLLSNDDRDKLIQLKAKIDRNTQISRSEMEKIEPGRVLRSLNPEQIRTYQASPEVQQLTQWLRKIKKASLNNIEPLQEFYPQQFAALPNGVLAYILVETPEFPDRSVLKFLASADPDPEPPHWPGNPIGEVYVPVSAIFKDAFKGEFQVADDYYTDQFYTCLTAVVPIKDRNGKVIAVLGLDYIAGTEQDYLRDLRSICWSIIAFSGIASIVLSLLLTRYFTGLRRKNQQLQDYSEDLEQRVQARTLELQVANQALQELATVDSLTQVFNRRYFDDALQAEWHRARRSHFWLTLILCDIDHFKAYNDTYGHPGGDRCLHQIAQGLQDSINRQTDCVARYGGEEFAIILPNTDLQGGLKVTENIRSRLHSLKIPHATSPTHADVTLSLGVVSVIPHAAINIPQLIQAADRALYQAKQSGRDRAIVYSEALGSSSWDQCNTKSAIQKRGSEEPL
jgi:diguanylate cyclase (GGDEF)-like protein